jgi:hypothetical protein
LERNGKEGVKGNKERKKAKTKSWIKFYKMHVALKINKYNI